MRTQLREGHAMAIVLLVATVATVGWTPAEAARILARGHLVERYEGNCLAADTETPDGAGACSRVLTRSGQVLVSGVPTGCEFGEGRARWAIKLDRLPDDSPYLYATASITGLSPACDGLIIALNIDLATTATTACPDVDPDAGVCTQGLRRTGIGNSLPENLPPGSTCTIASGACSVEVGLKGAYAEEMSFITKPSIDLYYIVPPARFPLPDWRSALSHGVIVR